MKNLLLIFIFLIGLNFTSSAQTRIAATGDQPQKLVKFYPNPATTSITFELLRFDKSYTLQVYNFMGKKVEEITNLTDRATVNLAGYNRGFYNYRLLDKSGQVLENGRFIVVK